MSEMKRATWAEFVDWVAQIELETSDAGSECWTAKRLRDASAVVTTRGEAIAAIIGACDFLPSDVGDLEERWLVALLALGVRRPVDAIGAAKALERIACQFDAKESDAASASSSLAWKTAARMARALAKELA
ncbi:hypothetical protein WMF38_57185 [Sorangium sp. So ce118]